LAQYFPEFVDLIIPREANVFLSTKIREKQLLTSIEVFIIGSSTKQL